MMFRNKVVGAALSLALLAGAGGAFASQQATYDRIANEMAELRQLELLEPLDIEFQSREQLRDWVTSEVESYTEADQAVDLRVFVIFGFMEPGTDLGQLEIDILGEQIAGYFDPTTGKMVVVSSGEGETLSASDELTFAHETVHALQDQNFDLLAIQGDPTSINDDQWLAVSALIEGDATTGQIEYLLNNPSLIRGLQSELANLDSSALDSAPPIYAKTLMFPYDEGATFVGELHEEGGWAAVDAAYSLLPQSTEQILHPDKYLAGEAPIPVTINDPMPALGPDWRVFDLNVMGEFITNIFLDSHGVDRGDARQAAQGWGGDQYAVIGTDDETALVWKSVWDSEEDAQEFFAALGQHELQRFDTVPASRDGGIIRFEGEAVVGDIRRNGDAVQYILAPDIPILETLLEVQAGNGPIMTLPESEPAPTTPVAGLK